MRKIAKKISFDTVEIKSDINYVKMKSEILEMNNFFILFQNSFIDLQVPSL